jgi:hypothetical protein
MKKGKQRSTGFKDVTCNKCGAQGHAPADRRHRRCPGGENMPLRPRHELLTPGTARGKWC